MESYHGYNSIIDVELSICFVHGLNGDPLKSWTSESPEKCCWPRDLLPKHFPSARIMTFGYNANLWSDTSKGRIAEFSENLLAELIGERFNPAVYFRPSLIDLQVFKVHR
jgi:hypothetical protein